MFFPTEFAKQIAMKVELHTTEDLWEIEDLKEKAKAELQIQKLTEFQQLAMYNPFEDAIIAYTGIKLNEEQKLALMMIAKSTIAWAKGHVADTLLSKISTTENERTMTQAAAILMGSLGFEEMDEKGKTTAKTLVVKLTKE